MTRTYLDSGILIAAAKGEPEIGAKALAIIEDDQRTFISSEAVRLEVLPPPAREGYPEQSEFYNDFFGKRVAEWVPIDRRAADVAIGEASKIAFQPLDALHVALAHLANADEFVTTEKPTKPVCTSNLVKAVSLLG